MISEKQLELSVIVPSLGEMEKLKSLLKSLAKQNIEFETFEVLIILNGFESGKIPQALLELQSEFSSKLNINYFTLEKKGANLARNEGIRRSQSQILLFLDDDCLLHQNFFLQQHIRFHRENADIFAYGGGYSLEESASFFEKVYNILQMRWFVSGRVGGETSRLVQYLLGGNFSVKKNIMTQRLIYFDESIVYGGTEYEFFKKANQQGLKIQSNDLDVVHAAGVGFFDLSRKISKQGRGKAIIDLKFPPEAQETLADYRADSFSEYLFLIYFNYVFWYGYFGFSGQYKKFFKKVFSDFIGKLNFFRFKLVEQNNKKIDGE